MYSSSDPATHSAASSFIWRTISSHVPTYVAPDTVLTLVDATKYIVAETLAEVVERVRDFRAGVLVRSSELQRGLPPAADGAADDVKIAAPVASLRLVNHPDEG